MRKRKLPEHTEALLCLGDAEQAYQPRGLEMEGRQAVSSCVGSYSRGAMCVGGVCVNLWTVITVERFASVFNFVFIAVRDECGIIYCPDHLYTIYTLQHFTSIRKLFPSTLLWHFLFQFERQESEGLSLENLKLRAWATFYVPVRRLSVLMKLNPLKCKNTLETFHFLELC